MQDKCFFLARFKVMLIRLHRSRLTRTAIKCERSYYKIVLRHTMAGGAWKDAVHPVCTVVQGVLVIYGGSICRGISVGGGKGFMGIL